MWLWVTDLSLPFHVNFNFSESLWIMILWRNYVCVNFFKFPFEIFIKLIHIKCIYSQTKEMSYIKLFIKLKADWPHLHYHLYKPPDESWFSFSRERSLMKMSLYIISQMLLPLGHSFGKWCPFAGGTIFFLNVIIKVEVVHYCKKGHHFLKLCPKGTVSVPPFHHSLSPTNQQVDISVWNQNIMNRTHNK